MRHRAGAEPGPDRPDQPGVQRRVHADLAGQHQDRAVQRQPLAAQFSWHGHTLFVINNHLDAKLEDDADFGRYQPPVLWSEIQRIPQTQLIQSFVTSLEKANLQAWVITLGDLNDQGFEPAITTLQRSGALVDTINRLPPAQRYDYVFDGDSETLSGLLVSPSLNRLVAWAGPVHINADFAGQTSDHDPLLAYINAPR
jgi:predicted extracellular nuclease